MKQNSLKINIWLYLILFSFGILIFLWFFQIIFLNQFYQINKTKQIKKTAIEIIKDYNNQDFASLIDKISYENEVCIEIFDKYTNLHTSSNYKQCLPNSNKYKKEFIISNVNNQTYQINNDSMDHKMLIYATKLDNELYLFVSSSLMPIGATIGILANQLVYVSIVVLGLSLLIGFFISKMISKPIEKITKNASLMAKGNYDIVFDDNSNIGEIDQLAKTLNYASSELSQTKELQSELIANVSHDLKTPLTMIKAYAEMVRDLTYDNEEKRNNNLNIIIEESDRLNNLVNDILALSTVQSKTEQLIIEEFDLIDLIKSIINRYNILEQTEQYKFILNYEANVIIKADKKRIEQVIYNLINNAINYTGKDNTVKINVIEADIIRVEIIDSGKGIAEKDLPFIWDKYYHSSKKHKRDMMGTGLGLSIVKTILNNHNFEYGVISKKNKGTTFYFEIKK